MKKKELFILTAFIIVIIGSMVTVWPVFAEGTFALEARAYQRLHGDLDRLVLGAKMIWWAYGLIGIVVAGFAARVAREWEEFFHSGGGLERY